MCISKSIGETASLISIDYLTTGVDTIQAKIVAISGPDPQ